MGEEEVEENNGGVQPGSEGERLPSDNRRAVDAGDLNRIDCSCARAS